MLVEGKNILEGELAWINRICSKPLDSDTLEAYTKWLSSKGENRSKIVRALNKVLQRKLFSTLPSGTSCDEEWLDIIGFNLIKNLKNAKGLAHVGNLQSLIRPAFRFSIDENTENEIPVGYSKLGGKPDLPSSMTWPLGKDCRATYNTATEGEERLAGFLGQINFEELSSYSDLFKIPRKGVLSLFCFQDGENDDLDKIGVAAYYFENLSELERTTPPFDLVEGNKLMDERRLNFSMFLDVPETYDGPWSADYKFDMQELDDFFCEHNMQNFNNLLGYAKATTGGNPTESKEFQHLIVLPNQYECTVHIQILKQDLEDRNFDRIKLAWVDFD